MYRIGRYIICILWVGFSIWLNSRAQPTWTVTTDTYHQTLVIGSEILTSDSAVLLEEGDILGVFFNDERNSICGGKITWGTGNADNALTVYNNMLIDNKTYADEGLYFKVWKKSQNCILDSVKGIFRARTDTSAAITASDTLNIYDLSGKPFQAGYTDTEFCNNEGPKLPITAPAEYKITYSSNTFAVNTATGEINPDGVYAGPMNIRFTSDYCLIADSQSITILPAPDIFFPGEISICEGIEVNSALNQYARQYATGTDSLWVSVMGEGVYVSPEVFDYNIAIDNGTKCRALKEVRIQQFQKPVIQWQKA